MPLTVTITAYRVRVLTTQGASWHVQDFMADRDHGAALAAALNYAQNMTRAFPSHRVEMGPVWTEEENCA